MSVPRCQRVVCCALLLTCTSVLTGAEKKLDELLALAHKADSIEFGFSNATLCGKHAPSLFRSLGVQLQTAHCDHVGAFKDVPPEFNWHGGEDARTAEATDRLRQLVNQVAGATWKPDWVGVHSSVRFSPVQKHDLPPVWCDQYRARGRTDAVVELDTKSVADNWLRFAAGFVEFKTQTAPMKAWQNVLEVYAGSVGSSFEQGVVLLATDLIGKWEVLHFPRRDMILTEVFEYGEPAVRR